MSKYIVRRTSIWRNTRPIKEAIYVDITHLDYRTVKTLAAARKAGWGDAWFSAGENHRAEDGMVVRELPRKAWVTDLEPLELHEKYGSVIILASDCKEYPVVLEIYDDYRE